MNQPTQGRTIIVITRNAKKEIVHRPAIINGFLPEMVSGEQPVFAFVFYNESVDGFAPTTLMLRHDETQHRVKDGESEYTWHWPERV